MGIFCVVIPKHIQCWILSNCALPAFSFKHLFSSQSKKPTSLQLRGKIYIWKSCDPDIGKNWQCWQSSRVYFHHFVFFNFFFKPCIAFSIIEENHLDILFATFYWHFSNILESWHKITACIEFIIKDVLICINPSFKSKNKHKQMPFLLLSCFHFLGLLNIWLHLY